MQFRKRPLLIIAVFVVFTVTVWTNYSQTRNPTRIVWEYKEAVNLSERDLDAVGAQGWEMFSYSLDGNGNRFMCFKRPK